MPEEHQARADGYGASWESSIDASLRERGRAFPDTQWSVVLLAGGPDRGAALARLAEAYWYPVYCFLRGRGARPDEARDLVQGFFARFLDHDDLAKVDRSRGFRFRSWLRTAAKSYFLNIRKSELVRGGRFVHFSLDLPGAEARLERELSHTRSPDQLFDRAWARTVTDRALSSLRALHPAPADWVLIRELEAELRGEPPAREPQQPPMSGSVRQRKRRRKAVLLDDFRACLRREILGTVASTAEIDDEILALLE